MRHLYVLEPTASLFEVALILLLILQTSDLSHAEVVGVIRVR